MKALLKTSLLGLALVSTASMAANFAGPEAGVSVTMNGVTNTIHALNADTTLGGQSPGFKLRGGYGFDMSNDAVVLLGLDFSATESEAGKVMGESVKIKNSWSLSVAPGLKLNDSTLAFVKLAYEAGKLTANSEEESISGFSYGAGLRTEINRTTFLETEIKQVNYKKLTSSGIDVTPSAIVGGVGVVFKF